MGIHSELSKCLIVFDVKMTVRDTRYSCALVNALLRIAPIELVSMVRCKLPEEMNTRRCFKEFFFSILWNYSGGSSVPLRRSFFLLFILFLLF